MIKCTALCGVIVAGAVHAAVIFVPADYPTIQEALINATTNDTIQVAPDTYYEHIVWPGTQGIVLMSESGPDSTIIDGLAGLRVITINTTVDAATIIDGFTIKNGSADKGAGIHCCDAAPTIRNNIICNNTASNKGGGIYCDEGNAEITDNLITANSAGDGGGFGCFLCSPSLTNNRITGNSAIGTYGVGGGIEAVDAYDIVISENVICDNHAANSGGGIFFYKSVAAIDYNDINDNTSTNEGSGIHFHQSGGELHYNNIFENGYAVYVSSIGGLIDAEDNWWGDSSGPYHATNPGGLGDTVGDHLDFAPWLFAPQGVEEQQEYAVQTSLNTLKVFPNPTEHRCAVEYTIATGSVVDITIYDNAGRHAQQLVSSYLKPGDYTCMFDGRNLTQGVYFVQLTTGNRVYIAKVLLLK